MVTLEHNRPALDDYYSPERVEVLLRQLAHFYARQPLREGETPSGSRLWRNPVESRMAQMGDLLTAIESLGHFAQLVVWSCVVFDEPYRAFAARHKTNIADVSRTKRRAIQDMAYYLGWRQVDNCNA